MWKDACAAKDSQLASLGQAVQGLKAELQAARAAGSTSEAVSAAERRRLEDVLGMARSEVCSPRPGGSSCFGVHRERGELTTRPACCLNP